MTQAFLYQPRPMLGSTESEETKGHPDLCRHSYCFTPSWQIHAWHFHNSLRWSPWVFLLVHLLPFLPPLSLCSSFLTSILIPFSLLPSPLFPASLSHVNLGKCARCWEASGNAMSMPCFEDEWFLDLKKGPYSPGTHLIHFFQKLIARLHFSESLFGCNHMAWLSCS